MNKKGRILIVDDEQPVCDLLSYELQQAGYAASAVTSGKEAVMRARAEQPDVALVDLIMEDMPGLAVMNAIGKSCPDTQCIVITGHAPEDSAIAAASLGAYAYLLKPVNLALLELTVSKAMQHAAVKKALRGAREALRALIGTTAGPAMLLNAEGALVELNEQAAEFLRETRENLLGKTIGGQAAPGLAGLDRASVVEAAETGATWRAAWPDGVAQAVTAAAVRDAWGEILHYLVLPANK